MFPRTRKPRLAPSAPLSAAPSPEAGEPALPLASAEDAAWKHAYYQLHEFQRQHGHCDLPAHDKTTGKLAAWVAQQRALHQRGKLRPDRQAALEALGLTWPAEQEDDEEPIRRPANDARWQQRYAELVAFRQEHGHTRVPKSLGGSQTLFNWRHIQRLWRRKGLLTPERIALLDAIGFEWVEPDSFGRTRGEMHEQHWEQMFQELVQFKARFGHCRVVAQWKENPNLAKWVARQRSARRLEQLHPERLARLETLGFTWQIGRGGHGDELWERQFADLLAFQAITGHTRVTKAAPGTVKLRNWRHIQREWRRRGDLKPERVARLDAIGFEWEEPGSGGADTRQERWDAQWERQYEALAAFRARFGHCRVVSEWRENPPLADWVGDQRALYKEGKLRPERQARLEALSFEWQIGRGGSYVHLWEQRFAELVAFQQEHGHTRVSKSRPEHRALWSWRHSQRAFRRKGLLSPERIARLDAIGFTWEDAHGFSLTMADHPERRWQAMLERLRQFQQQHGHTRVPKREPGRPSLGAWALQQRSLIRQGKMSPAHRAALDQLGFEFLLPATPRDPKPAVNAGKWTAQFEKLRQFHERFGHTRVPRRWTEDPPLALWVREQRRAGQRDRLPADRRARLESLGFSFEPATASQRPPRPDTRGDRRLAQLAAFRERFGHTRVPKQWSENPGLGNWLAIQRHLHRKGRLSPQRLAQLEALGVVWEPDPGSRLQDSAAGGGRMAQLAAYRERFGDTRVPKKWRENPGLGAWVSVQRHLRRKGRLSARRIAGLDALGFTWEAPRGPRGFVPLPESVARLQQLAAYRERFGHTRVPRNWPEDPGFGCWVYAQRYRLRHGTLSAERRAQLAALGFE